MPQNLPDWAEPAPGPSPKPSHQPNGPRPENGARDVPRDGYTEPSPLGPASGGETQVIWPAPGEDCGTCDVSGLVINGVDCDANPESCEQICCTYPAPDACADAYSEGPCAVPLPAEFFIMLAGALIIGGYHLKFR